MNRRIARLGPNLNWQLIVPVVSGAMLFVALGMLVCLGMAVVDGDGELKAFWVPAAVMIPLSGLGLRWARRLRSVPLRARDGFLAVTLAWVTAAAAGAVPFMIEGTLPNVGDAFFESMSGFTTTGASLLTNVEAQPDAILLWRSLSQWLGGVGIVVLVVAIAPAAGLASQRIFHAETSGVTAERLTPRIAETAKIVAGIYVALTVAGFLAFMLAGMGPFDAINHIFTTLSTGGFSARDGSLAAFDSVAVELVAIAFMAIAGVNFAFYWRALRGQGIWPQAAEVRGYLIILFASVALITLSLVLNERPGGFWANLRVGAFSATSMVTGTGFTTVDYNGFNDYARVHLLLLMFVGGCAGSTSGGLKVIRVMLLAKTAGQEVQRQLRPKAVQVLRTRGRVFNEDVRRGVLGFFFIYLAVGLCGTIAMLVCGLELVEAGSTAFGALNLVGAGLGTIGVTESYSAVPEAGRGVLAFLMLAGRLEIFTVLVLFTPAFWRPNIA
jgi:trk system potassium uptake protein TrkH